MKKIHKNRLFTIYQFRHHTQWSLRIKLSLRCASCSLGILKLNISWHSETILISLVKDNFIKNWFVQTINVASGVARVLRALVQRYVMGPLVTKQLRNSFVFFVNSRASDKTKQCNCKLIYMKSYCLFQLNWTDIVPGQVRMTKNITWHREWRIRDLPKWGGPRQARSASL